jgi:hypothetical protein
VIGGVWLSSAYIRPTYAASNHGNAINGSGKMSWKIRYRPPLQP